ncbi:MAG: diacylglycerol kinase family lipid kinase [Bacteroidales bacterium]|nr:diacylglycerol kinase family lipid kinase [Bacteroidales bacterium]
MKKILYIVNPKSGVGKKKEVVAEIAMRSATLGLDCRIVQTTHRGHATEIAEKERDNVDAVVAVGGDGTVNEVGLGMIGSSTPMGIIPCGSGNGLARELDIPLRTSMAVDLINELNTKRIDVIKIGPEFSLTNKLEYWVSFNVAGIGFDAYISHRFADKKRRGPLQYMNLIAKEFPDYVAKEYVLDIEGHIYSRRAFLISFANSSQWGNDIHIAPHARMDDGLMDVCVVSEFPNMAIPSLVISLLNQSIDNNKYDEIIRTKRVELHNPEPIMGHVDGEPVMFPVNTVIEVVPNALNVIVPSTEFYQSRRFDPQVLRQQVAKSVNDQLTEFRQNLINIKTILEP